jgi:hypothetical protein
MTGMLRPFAGHKAFSPQERKALRRAYWQLEEIRRRRRWVWYFISRQFVVLAVLPKLFLVCGVLSPALLAIVPLENLWYWRRYRWLSLRFPENMQLLQGLRDQGLDVREVMKR